jgi:hypothetical protein
MSAEPVSINFFPAKQYDFCPDWAFCNAAGLS